VISKKRFGICFLVSLALVLLTPGGGGMQAMRGSGPPVEFLLFAGRLFTVLLVAVGLYEATLLIDRIRARSGH
jgi:hypothetical protein